MRGSTGKIWLPRPTVRGSVAWMGRSKTREGSSGYEPFALNGYIGGCDQEQGVMECLLRRGELASAVEAARGEHRQDLATHRQELAKAMEELSSGMETARGEGKDAVAALGAQLSVMEGKHQEGQAEHDREELAARHAALEEKHQEVAALVAAKADRQDLEKKADRQDLAAKADRAEVDAGLERVRAGVAAIESAVAAIRQDLAAKAERSDVDAGLEQVRASVAEIAAAAAALEQTAAALEPAALEQARIGGATTTASAQGGEDALAKVIIFFFITLQPRVE